MIFVDTTFWVGSADQNDEFHESSRSVIGALRNGETPFAITTDYVLNETVTLLGRRKGFGAENASKAASLILSSPRVFTIYVDEPIFKETLELYPNFKGRLGMTDTSSLVVMKKYGVKEIYSHDRDFDSIKGVVRREKFSAAFE